MFHLQLAEDSAKAASRYMRAFSDAMAAWSAVAAHNATIAPRVAGGMLTGGPAVAPTPDAEWAADAMAAILNAQRASFAANAEFWRAATSWRATEFGPSPFGVTGLFSTAHPEPHSAPIDAAKAPAKPAAPSKQKKTDTGTAAAERSALLTRPVGEPDDLTRIKGVGPKVAETLHEIGIFHFWQIASLSAEEIERVNDQLRFKGRVEREGWVEQARELMQPVR